MAPRASSPGPRTGLRTGPRWVFRAVRARDPRSWEDGRVLRQVRGILFLDYVRMLRAQKRIDWSAHVRPDDLPYLTATIEPHGWYPMGTFERFGNLILRHVAQDQLPPVQLWGRHSARMLHEAHPMLLAPGDPIETLERFRVMRETFFDFDAQQLLMLVDGEAQLVIRYHMGMPAEEAASIQTLGFFEGLLELAGAQGVAGSFRERSWANALRTVLVLRWQAR